MNRFKKMRRSNILVIITLSLISILIVVVFGFELNSQFNPKLLTSTTHEKTNNVYVNVIAASSGDYDKKVGYVHEVISFEKEKNEAIVTLVAVDSKEKSEKLEKATEENPIKIVGKTRKYKSSSVYSEMKDYYGSKIQVARVGIVEKTLFDSAKTYVFFIVGIGLVLFALLKKIGQLKMIHQFEMEHPELADALATQQFHKNLEIIGKYLVISNSNSTIIDLTGVEHVDFTQHYHSGFKSHIVMHTLFKDGTKKDIVIPKMKDIKLQEFIDFLNSNQNMAK